MSSKANEAGLEMQDSKDMKTETDETERPETQPKESSRLILLCLPVIYKYWKLVAIIVAIIMAIYIAVSVIFVVGTVTILIKQNEKISAIEAKLQHEAEMSDIRVYENLLQEIEELEQNISDIVLQLEKDHSEEVRAIRETFNEWNKTLVNATAKISQLEDTLNNAKMRINELEQDQTQLASELTQIKQDLITTNDSLHDARKQISQLERDLSNMTDRTSMIERDQLQHTIEQMQMREDLNATGERLNNALDIITLLEDGLTNTTHRTAVVEAELLNIKIEVLSLNDTKASKVVVNEITDRVADLETGKVDKTEFAILSDNVTSLREDTSQADEDIREDLNDLADSTLNYTHYHQLQDGIDKLKQSKANQSNFEHLVMHVSDLENSTVQTSDFVQLVESIESTTAEIGMEIALKANQSEVNTLTEQITNLTATVVDRVEFDSLSINVTILRESTALEDETLHAEIEALANGSLNLTYHDQLKILIEQFALTKANQTDFEDLAFDVVTLANSTVRTNDFNQLAETVDGIDHTIMIIQDNITLATKADQDAIDSLSQNLDSLSDNTVRTTTFDSAIQTLSTDKADQSDLESLQEEVDHLDDITAKANKLNTLETSVTQHITSSDNTHVELSTEITSNGHNIENNRHRIENTEDDIKQLKDDIADSSHRLKQFWTMIIVSALVAILFTYY